MPSFKNRLKICVAPSTMAYVNISQALEAKARNGVLGIVEASVLSGGFDATKRAVNEHMELIKKVAEARPANEMPI